MLVRFIGELEFEHVVGLKVVCFISMLGVGAVLMGSGSWMVNRYMQEKEKCKVTIELLQRRSSILIAISLSPST